jgi:short-chain Z-isoprenyl diphosphate synthase
MSNLFHLLEQSIKQRLYALHLKRLEREAPAWHVPYHLALILDGNRRFAKKHHIWDVSQRRFGHDEGADKLEEILHWCQDFGIKIVTAWIFSTDNFKRDSEEVATIFELVKRKAAEFILRPDVHANRIKIRFLGELEALPIDVQAAIHAAEAATEGYDQYLLNICISYGGREEIVSAVRQHLQTQLAQGKTLAEVAATLSPDAITRHLYTAGLPDPDLIIRTSGELRLGGFLLWQSVYSEYYFCPTYWPEFSRLDFLRALRAYHTRQRRYGK